MRTHASLGTQATFSLLWRRALLATTCLSLGSVAHATPPTLPSGGSFAYGSGTIAINPAQTVETVTTNGNTIINWSGGFSIGAGGKVNIFQPGTSSISVERVTGGGKSLIQDTLGSNGQVWIINPSGVLFGPNASVNVAGMIATTADINDTDFQNGNYKFHGATTAPIVNNGTIAASQYAVLAGSRVVNSKTGTVAAKLGVVELAAGKDFALDFNGDGLIHFSVRAPVDTQPSGGNPNSALISNAGQLIANGGTVLMTARAVSGIVDDVINTSGIVEAQSASLGPNGDIVLGPGVFIDAGKNGAANVQGTIDVSGTQNGVAGGTVGIAGHTIAVGANINAQGGNNANGGNVFIGGDANGNPAVPLGGPWTTPLATSTTLQTAATIDASSPGGGSGNGGIVAIWATAKTNVQGNVNVNGGVEGSGGLITLGASGDQSSKLLIGGGGSIYAPRGVVNLVSTGTIFQGTNNTITAGTLNGQSTGGATLTNLNNAIDFFGNFENEGGGLLALSTSGTLRTGGDIESAGNLQLTGGPGAASFGGSVSGVGVTIQSINDVGLSAGTNIAGTFNLSDNALGKISAQSLTLRTNGAGDALNIDGVTAHPNLGPVTAIGAGAITIGPGGASFASSFTLRPKETNGIMSLIPVALNGPITAVGDLAIHAGAGDLAIGHALTSTEGNVFLEATNGSITGGATVTAGGGNLSLVAGNSVGSIAQPLQLADPNGPLTLAGLAGTGDFIVIANAPGGLTVGPQVTPPFDLASLLNNPGVSAAGTVGIKNSAGSIILADNVTANDPNVFLEARGGGSISSTGGEIVFLNGGGGLSLVAEGSIGPLTVSSPGTVTYATDIVGAPFGGSANLIGASLVAGNQPTPAPTGFLALNVSEPAPPVLPPVLPSPPPNNPPNNPPSNSPDNPAPNNPTPPDQLNLIVPAAGGEADSLADCIAAPLKYRPPQQDQGNETIVAGLLYAEPAASDRCATAKHGENAPGQDFFSGWGRLSLW